MRKHAGFIRAVPLPFLIMTILLLGALTCVMPGLAVSPAFASSGTGWVEQTPVPDGPDLYAVDAVDDDIAWAVGANGTILKAIDGGDNWETQRSGETEYLRGVCAVDAMTAWAVGDTGADAVVPSTDDGGRTWVSHDAVTTLFREVPGGE